MSVISISYNDHSTGTNFDFTTEIRTPHISGSLNAMVSVLRLMGFADKTIEDYIGETYFVDDYDDDEYPDEDDECCECCGCRV